MMLAQLAASHLVLWQAVASGRASEADAKNAAALLELLDRIEAASDLRQACYVLVNEVRAHLRCGRVAVALRRGKGRCRLAAISGVAQFDKRSRTVQVLESALDEAVLRDAITTWPPADREQRHASLAHKTVCSLEDVRAAVSAPLRTHHGQSVGALIVMDEDPDRLAGGQQFLRAAERSLATSLDLVRRLEGGWWARLLRRASGFARGWKGCFTMAAVTCLVAAMAAPVPHKIRCRCQIEPITRRFVAAPFDGTLEESLVEPGDIVRAGEVLARMDGREIRWERASVAADHDQASKRRDAAQAAHEYADAQIAELEMQRLDLQLKLLEHRSQNLEIRSPVDGIVASGDLERVEGAPLTKGQTLFEIAPLERMLVEAAVEDEDIAHIRAKQPMTVWLDAYPGQSRQVRVARVQPRSEIRDSENVFIAEAPLANSDGRLRPGMKGRAKIVAPNRRLGWILFHKPWEYLVKRLTW
jgi:hypothetical protein